MKSFWECDRLRFEDLPTMGDLIWDADWDILSSEVVELFDSSSGEVTLDTVKMALEEMEEIPQRPPSSKWMFLPMAHYEPGGKPGLIRWSVEPVLVRRRDFKTIAQLHKEERLQSSARDCVKDLKRACKRLGERYPNYYAWSLSSWDKVLSFRVWMQGDFGRKQRYEMLAGVVFEMLTLGLTWDEARFEQQVIKEGLKAESKAFKAGDARGNPAELLMRDYGLESTTDDYETEYQSRADDAVLVLNYNSSVDVHRRISELLLYEKRARKLNV